MTEANCIEGIPNQQDGSWNGGPWNAYIHLQVRTSPELAALAAAMAKAQGIIEGATKDSSNPYFKSKYADLAAVWEAVRKPLSSNGLSVVQMPAADGAKVTITTLLMHSSGQWISSELTMTAKDATPQSVGSAITYARRYALQSVAGVAPEDDDGNAAQGRVAQKDGDVAQFKGKKDKHTPEQQASANDTIRQLIDSTMNTMHQKFVAAGHGPVFLQIVGAHGYESERDIPDYDKAKPIVDELKQRLRDLTTK